MQADRVGLISQDSLVMQETANAPVRLPSPGLVAIQQNNAISLQPQTRSLQLKSLSLTNPSGLSFEKNIDSMIFTSLSIHGGLLELPNSPALSVFSTLSFSQRLAKLMKKDTSRVINNITFNTLVKTQEKRQALIKSVGEMILHLVHDASTQIPEDAGNLSREAMIDALAKRLFAFVETAAGDESSQTLPIAALEAYLPAVTKQLTSQLGKFSKNVMEHFAKMGDLGGRLIAAGPRAQQDAQEQSPLAFAEQVVGFLNANRRPGEEQREAQASNPQTDTLQAFLDANQNHLISICGEYSFGALSRMCEDPANKDILGLVRHGLRCVILSELSQQAPVQDDSTLQLLPHMKEAQKALKELLSDMQTVFLQELHSEIYAELGRQQLSAKTAFSTTMSVTSRILEFQARAISATLMGTIAPQTILGITRDAPLALAATASNALRSFLQPARPESSEQKLIEEGVDS